MHVGLRHLYTEAEKPKCNFTLQPKWKVVTDLDNSTTHSDARDLCGATANKWNLEFDKLLWT
jgi:hypothetical protein